MKTRKGATNKAKKTRSNRNKSSSLTSFEKEIVVKFLEVSNTVKLYHWKTMSYATHKATDELYAKIGTNMDSFVEVLLGKRGDRVHLEKIKHISLKDFNNVSDFKREIDKFKSYLVSLDTKPALMSMSNTDLFNIRDELLANLNQFLYLLTFK
jgi:DNA-binding ferritin-like protein